MKTLRLYSLCFLFVVSALLPGCASTRSKEDAAAREAQAKAWDELSTGQKILSSLFLPFYFAAPYFGMAD